MLAHPSYRLSLAKRRRYVIGLLCEKIAKRISAGYRLFFRDEVTAI